MGRAKEALRFGNPNHAVDLLERLLTENPKDERAISLLIKAHGLAGRTNRARDVFDYAVQEGIADQHIYSAMISTYCRMGQVLPASALIEDARKRGMDEGYTYCSLIHSYGKRGLPEEAERYFKLAKESGKDDAAVYTAMMGVYRKRRDVAAVNVLLQEARKRGATDPDLYGIAILSNLEAGNPGAARAAYQLAFSGGHAGPKLMSDMANAYYSNRMFDDEVRFINSLPARIRRNSKLRLMKADALRKLKRYDAAIETANSILKMRRGATEGRQDSARIIIGYCLDRSGRHAEAFDLFTKMRAHTSPNSWHYARMLCGLVFSWERLGCDSRLGTEELKTLRENLKKSLSRASENLRHDIFSAMRIIDRYFAPDVST